MASTSTTLLLPNGAQRTVLNAHDPARKSWGAIESSRRPSAVGPTSRSSSTSSESSMESKKRSWSTIKASLSRKETPEQRQKRKQEFKDLQLHGKVVFGMGGPQSSFFGSY